MTIQDIAQAIEAVAPRELQESYDNAGLQCGDPHAEVTSVLTCLDVTEQVIEEAHAKGCQLVVAHHPLLFRGVKCINPEADYISRTLMAAIRYGVGIYAAHTNLDRARGGINDTLAELLGLTGVQPLSDCGVWGYLPRQMSARELLAHVSERLGGVTLRYNREALRPDDCPLSTLALCGGAGGEFIDEAESLCLDAFLTGEVHYHSYFGHPDLLILEAGHYETERHATRLLADLIARACLAVRCYETETQGNPCAWF